jgi:hypothetical protein
MGLDSGVNSNCILGGKGTIYGMASLDLVAARSDAPSFILFN